MNAEINRAQEKARKSGGMPGLVAYSQLEDTQQKMRELGQQLRVIPGAVEKTEASQRAAI